MKSLAMLLFLGANYSFCQIPAIVEPAELSSQPSLIGSKLKHFGTVDEGVYKGSRPKSDADYRFLQSLHVKYIVDLQVLRFLTRFEKRKTKKYGITVIPGIMNASPFSPSEKHVNRILTTLRDEGLDKKPGNICKTRAMALSMGGCEAANQIP